MGLPAPELQPDNVSLPAPDGGWGGVQPPIPGLIKPVVVPPSPPRARPRMPQARQQAMDLLASVGVDAAVGVAWQFEPAQIRAVVARWEARNEDGESLGPGWIVWRLRQGPIKMKESRIETSWWEERYRRGKAVNQ
jgi:hypothetical protein